jgi:two-component system alkaline phosphatase synthesis response regulator PhoP
MIGNMPTILVVDDEHDILEFIRYNLEKEGYHVFTALNGSQALDQAAKIKPDLILMDVMMPVMDGIEACRNLRQSEATRNCLIVFLTARAEEFVELAGFEAGADDFINKPIKPRVLLSRIKAILRRQDKGGFMDNMKFPDLEIDREKFLVLYKERPIQFPRKEFELLSFLASKPGKVFSREEILDQVWGADVEVVDRTIDVHVRKIREKLDDRFIYTVKGVGYKFDTP